MENDIVPKYGYEIRNIKATGFNRKKLLKNYFSAGFCVFLKQSSIARGVAVARS